MMRTIALLKAIAGGLLAVTLTVAAADPPPPSTTDKEPPDPPGTTLYMSQLRALFDAWDLDKDGYLDKQELAIAFRGMGAKPYDYDPKTAPKADPSKTDPSKTDPDPTRTDPGKADPAKADPAKGDPAKTDPAKTDPGTSSSGGSSTTKTPDYSKYPDYNFLVQLDSDSDGKVSRKEFMSWARDYAVQLKAQQDLITATQLLQAKLATAKPGSSEYKKLEAELKKQDAAMKKAQSQVKSFEQHLAQSMKTHTTKH